MYVICEFKPSDCNRRGYSTMDKVNLGNVMVDCNNEQELCQFYHQLLGWEKCIMYGRPAVRSENGVVFLFMEEKEYVPPIWPEIKGAQQKQMHFDFQVPSVEEAVIYAESIGAIKVPDQFGNGHFVTMLDPAGHPFCLCAASNKP